MNRSTWSHEIDHQIDTMAEDLRTIRRHLHAHPEPSREEFETTRLLADHLTKAGIPYRVAPSGRGLIAGPERSGSVPYIAFRGDIDALYIPEANDVAYRSTRPGVMHACGHDAHATMVLGAAVALTRAAETLPVPLAWRAIFQPAEEVAEGAVEMVAAGALEDIDAILALHVDPERDVGTVGQRAGVLTAHSQSITVTVHGRGAHGARPYLGADPIAAAAQFISAVYQSVPRATDAREPFVVSFGAIAGGNSPNVIPEQVLIRGTLRTLGRAEAVRVRERLGRISRGVAEACDVTIMLDFGTPTDAVVNDPAITAAFVEAATAIVGPSRIASIALPSMGGEDFSVYLNHVPGCLLRLGVGVGPEPRPGLHHPRFDIDERALPIGAKILAHGVVEVATKLGSAPDRSPDSAA
jgi:amidohydrolase